jgi:Tfp pilus assembly protein PilN
MLRTNLSTRPFYNERAVRTALGALAALAIGLTLFNTYEILRLQGQSRDSRQAIAQNDAQAREMREKAEVIRRSIDKEKLAVVQAAAREANSLIDRRTFSWTELLNLFQATLPPDVRIAGVTPQMDNDGQRLVQISVFSRRIEDLEEFMAALEKTGAFSGVLPRSESTDESGTLRTELQAYYRVVPRAAGTPPAASEPDKAGPAKEVPVKEVPAGTANPGVVR